MGSLARVDVEGRRFSREGQTRKVSTFAKPKEVQDRNQLDFRIVRICRVEDDVSYRAVGIVCM